MKRPVLIKITCLMLLSLSLIACTGDFGLEQDPDREQVVPTPEVQIEISLEEAPVIDGVIEEGEWQGAMIYHADDGSELHLLFSGGHLYLAIRAEEPEMIAGNVFLENEGQISVLHTSAALGSALYEADGDQYKKTRDFAWCCRSRIDNEGSRKAREEFYSEEGWLGINSFLGIENELEYKISLQDDPETLAVNLIYADGEGEKQVWPEGLEDGVAQPTDGGFPDLLDFSVENWISLEDLK